MLCNVNAAGFKDALTHFHTLPRWLEFQFVLTKCDLGGASHLLSGVSHHLLGEFHHLQIIGVRPIEFKLRKFRVVLERHAFVAEVTSDLIDSFQVTHEQTFEIQLE